MIRQFSAGGIVLRQTQDKFLKGEKAWKVLLIRSASMTDPQKSYWGFPKGHIEKGEKSEQAALREITEETGINAEVIKKLGDSRYTFTNPQKERIFKVVVFYLMEYLEGEVQIDTSEIAEADWLTPEEALQKLSFSNDKDFLKKAITQV